MIAKIKRMSLISLFIKLSIFRIFGYGIKFNISARIKDKIKLCRIMDKANKGVGIKDKIILGQDKEKIQKKV